jgi:hypothetical protein
MARFALVCTGALMASFVVGPAFAQKLPPPSRTVFKCETDGKVVYSDSPCLGARRVDVQPSRGLNKSSGTERIGPDVRRERHDDAMADAMRPLFGESTEQRATRHRRFKLTPEAQLRCRRLDARVADAEAVEAKAGKAELAPVQARLLALRKEHLAIGC